MKTRLQKLLNDNVIKVADIIAFIIVLLSAVVIYFSVISETFGTEEVILTAALVLISLIVSKLDFKSLIDFLPSVIICIAVLIVLLVSGKYNETGFNAPVGHALKFVDIAFVQAIAVTFRRFDKTKKSIILNTALLTVLVSLIISIYYVKAQDIYAIRYFQDRGFDKVFDFNQMYSIPIIITIIVYFILSSKKEYLKFALIYIPLLIAGIYCVYISLYTTALLLMIAGIALDIAVWIFMLLYKKSKKALLIVLCVCVLLVLLCVIFSQQLSDLIYKMTENMNWIVRDRIRSVADTVFRTDHDLDYSYERREELAGYSIETFKKHPLIGIGYAGYEYGVIGCHQEWQDMLGVFGIIGVVLFVAMMLFYCYIALKKAETLTDRISFSIALVIFIVLGFLNPCLSTPVLFALFVIAPNISALNPFGFINNTRTKRKAQSES